MILPMKKVIISIAVVIFAAAVSVAVWYFCADKKVEQAEPVKPADVSYCGSVAAEKESKSPDAENNTDETAVENMKIDMIWVDESGKKVSCDTAAKNMREIYPMVSYQLQFRRGEGVLYSDYMYAASYATIKHGKDRCKWQQIYSFGDDWKKLLCDVNNDGKPKYLILCSTSVGFTGRAYCSADIIKIEDGRFRKVGEFFAKSYSDGEITGSFGMPEICSCQSKDDRLCFNYYDEILYGGARGDVNMQVCVYFKDGEWFWNAKKRAVDIKSLYLPKPGDEVDDYSKELAFMSLAAHLAECGHLKFLRRFAEKHHFSTEEINRWGKNFFNMIMMQDYGKALLKFNGIELFNEKTF